MHPEMTAKQHLLSLISFAPRLVATHGGSRAPAKVLQCVAAQPPLSDRLREHNEQRARIASLDGLRAVSITFVVITHLAFTAKFPIASGIPDQWFENLASLGVRIFFVISGFLITNLLLNELEAEQTIHLPRFYFRRTLRIFVPYYFFLLVIIMLQALGGIRLTFNDFLHAATYTMNYYPQPSWELGHAWSLSVEEQFYLLWPAILLLTGKRRGLWIASAFFFAIAPAIRLGYSYFQPSLIPYQIGYRFETTADAIAIGCLLAGTHEWLRRQPLYHRALKSKLFIVIPFIVLYAGIVMDHQFRRYLLVGIPVQNLGIAACIAWCVTNYSGRIGKFLNAKPMVFLGKMSYSVYLWQQLFLDPYSSAIVARFPLNLVMVGATSLIAHYLVERPSLEIRQRLEGRVFARRKREVMSPVR
jgi:peptidoglycan/LPS O-acetylase OafA/YrhL